MKTTYVITFAALIAGAGWRAAAETAIFDRNGRLTSMFYSGEEVGLRGRVQIPSFDGSRVAEPSTPARGGGRAGAQSVITTEGGAARVRQTVTEEGGRTWIDLEVTADADLDIPGVYYIVDLPRTEFSGGQANLQSPSGARSASLPVHKSADREFFNGTGSELAFTGAHDLKFTINLDRARPIALGDRWDRMGGRVYTAAIQMHAGRMAAAQTASMRIGLALRGARTERRCG